MFENQLCFKRRHPQAIEFYFTKIEEPPMMKPLSNGIAAIALALVTSVACADNFSVYGGSAYKDVLHSQADVNRSAAGAIDRESRANARLTNSHADYMDNRVRVKNRTENTEVFGTNTSNVADGIGSIGSAAQSIGAGAAALRWGFR
ncbi:hypothetical protein [uncultured Thiocystis sp.]|uniref:hypothetical protein n=1 Tax=uncultured Thiocystis sp. TaxID=1202134 RepID=UPI0025FB98E1|nr:hypothetical protein [uncultured Thiocystis sp.]